VNPGFTVILEQLMVGLGDMAKPSGITNGT